MSQIYSEFKRRFSISTYKNMKIKLAEMSFFKDFVNDTRGDLYPIMSKSGMQTAKFNYPDGGFRGWGTVVPVKLGSRTRYFWLTFDRHNGSSYNWSYGNLYCFEAKYR